MSEKAASVASAVEEQDAATQEIARNIEEASAGSREVSTNIVEVTRAANDSGTASSQVLQAAQRLSEQAEEMRRFCDGFIAGIRDAKKPQAA